MQRVLEWLTNNHEQLVNDLSDLVAIQSVSNDGQHQKEIGQSAALTKDLMVKAGFRDVEVLTCGDSNPYVYGEILAAPGKPTVFVYSHHDVQPVHQKDIEEGKWHSSPFKLTRKPTPKGNRLYARGASDDKGGVIAQLGAISAVLKSQGSLPVNIKMLVEGEEEIGSPYLLEFFKKHRDRIQSDVILVCDTDLIDTGVPSLTYSLRGNAAFLVEVESAELPVHSGVSGGALPDAAIALNRILARLIGDDNRIAVPGYCDQVRPLTEREKKAIGAIAPSDEKLRSTFRIQPGARFAWPEGSNFFEATWRNPALTVIAQEASSIRAASNQVLPRASAIVSCRLVPDQDPEVVSEKLCAFLMKDPPWNVKVTVKPHGKPVKWWMTDPNGPAFEAALAAMKAGYGREPVAIGSGGTIGFVGPLAELFGGAPALLFGIGDPNCNAHAPDESLGETDWSHLMVAIANLFHNLGTLQPGKVK
jgi:cysteinylglycine-S-conjugate dipeptidase